MGSSRSLGPQVVCFGVYEADLRSGELRKQGLRVRLPEQPFQVLAILLEHPGEAVAGSTGRFGRDSPTHRNLAAPRVSLYWVPGCQARAHRVAGGAAIGKP